MCLVAHTDKARHVGLNHHVLLGHSLALYVAIQHVGTIGHTHESPCGQTLGQRELHHHLTLLVGRQLRITEGGLVQVLAHLHVFFLLGFLRVAIHYDLFESGFIVSCSAYGSGFCHRCCCFIHRSVFHHGCCSIGFQHHSAATTTYHHRTKIGNILRIDAIVEMTERPAVYLQRRLVALRGIPRQLVGTAELPRRRRLRQIIRGRERPLVLFNLVEALVVEHCHQRGVSRCAVGIHDAQAPLFLLTGSQSVAEGFPRQSQPLVGHRTPDGLLVPVTLSVLHPGIGNEQAVAIFFLIGEFPVQQLGILLHYTTFYHLVTGIDAIDDVEVGIAGTYLYGDGLAVAGELAVRHIEPVVGLGGGLLVVKSEHHESHVYRVVFTYCFQTVFTALK